LICSTSIFAEVEEERENKKFKCKKKREKYPLYKKKIQQIVTAR